MKVNKIIEWDMGHRVPNHKSKCSNLHGHRYKIELCVEGDLVNKKGLSDEGMVLDFSDLKIIFKQHVHDSLDHACMIWEKDKIFTEFFSQHKDQKSVIVPFVPTAENIALWIFEKLEDQVHDKYKTYLKLYSVKLWETPTSAAICTREDFKKAKS